jgi:hypothetical protein
MDKVTTMPKGCANPTGKIRVEGILSERTIPQTTRRQSIELGKKIGEFPPIKESP